MQIIVMGALAWRKLQCLFVLSVAVRILESTKMKVTGKVTVPSLEEGVSLAGNSYLTVKFEDTSVMDTAAVLIGEQEQKLAERTKIGPGVEPLNYTIVCDKPEELAPTYSVSAVLNVGWKTSGDDWIRKGDYFTDTSHDVELTADSDHVIVDIKMVPYH